MLGRTSAQVAEKMRFNDKSTAYKCMSLSESHFAKYCTCSAVKLFSDELRVRGHKLCMRLQAPLVLGAKTPRTELSRTQTADHTSAWKKLDVWPLVSKLLEAKNKRVRIGR